MFSMDDKIARPFLKGVAPSFSPDGKWVAYASNQSGQSEIYVQPVSGASGTWQISTTGGVEPLWARTGTELFYRDADKVQAVDVQTEPSFVHGNPRTLFEGSYNLDGFFSRQYDVTSDSRRFLMVTRTPATRPLNIVLNWSEELKRLVPVP